MMIIFKRKLVRKDKNTTHYLITVHTEIGKGVLINIGELSLQKHMWDKFVEDLMDLEPSISIEIE